MKYISIDLETTGLDPKTCQVLEIGAVIDDLEKLAPLSELPKFKIRVSHDIIRGTPYAINLNQEIIKDLAYRPDNEKLKKIPNIISEESAISVFREWIEENYYDEDNLNKEIIAAGKCFATFDRAFLKAMSQGETLINPRGINRRIIDPAILYYKSGDLEIPDTLTCMKRAGFPNDWKVAHDALEDAIVVVQLIRKKFKGFPVIPQWK